MWGKGEERLGGGGGGEIPQVASLADYFSPYPDKEACSQAKAKQTLVVKCIRLDQLKFLQKGKS